MNSLNMDRGLVAPEGDYQVLAGSPEESQQKTTVGLKDLAERFFLACAAGGAGCACLVCVVAVVGCGGSIPSSGECLSGGPAGNKEETLGQKVATGAGVFCGIAAVSSVGAAILVSHPEILIL